MRLFAERNLRDLLDGRIAEAKRSIDSTSDEELLAADESDLVHRVSERYCIERLIIRTEDVYFDPRHEMIPAEHFPHGGFTVRRGEQYRKPVMDYHVPFEGNRDLLNYGVPPFQWTLEVRLVGSEIVFDIVDFSEAPRRVEQEALEYIEQIRRHGELLDRNVVSFNAGLPGRVAEFVRQRRSKAEAHSAALAGLKIPVRRISPSTLPATLTVPARRKPVILAPTRPARRREREWVLSDDIYEGILALLHDWMGVMERHPSTYAGKGEEALRDLLLLLLAPHFEFSGGETFNRTGKTDILIRHEKKNVFVAECKMWRGQAKLPGAIDQVLSYLTWRDSKAALILFVKNQDIARVLTQIERTTAEHPCHVRLRGKPAEGWYHFDLRLAPDSTRHARCAILVAHLPDTETAASGQGSARRQKS